MAVSFKKYLFIGFLFDYLHDKETEGAVNQASEQFGPYSMLQPSITGINK